MLPEHAEILSKETLPEDVQKLGQNLKEKLNFSFQAMSQYFDAWDRYSYAYRSQKLQTEKTRKEDADARKNAEPEKMVVPSVYAQVDTFVAFAYNLLRQKDNFFTMAASGVEDFAAAQLAEKILERDLQESQFYGKTLITFLQNVAVYNIGICKHSWVSKRRLVEKIVQQPDGLGGMIESVENVEEIVWEGNKIINISPYRFRPDPRLPISRYQEGEFCGDEMEYSFYQLQQFEKDGMLAGLKYVKKISGAEFDRRRFTSSFNSNQASAFGLSQENQPQLVSEIQVNLIPKEILFGGKPLGEETYPVKFIFWIVNDDRIVRISRADYPHELFTYHVGLYHYDEEQFLSFGIAELICEMQDIMSWLINSHITSVRNVISDRLLVDPKGVEMDDIIQRKYIIRTKPGFMGMGADRFIRQLPVQDVTQAHINDVAVLQGFTQNATGITENLMGLFASGRRSATEARNVSSNAAARLKKVVIGIWENAFGPMGRCMLDNHRVALSEEQLIKIIGEVNAQLQQDGIAQLLVPNADALYGNYDFMPFDGTLPQEGYNQALVFQQFLEIASKVNPQLLQVVDLPKLVFHWFKLMGVKNVEYFVRREALGLLTGPASQPGMAGSYGAVPDAIGAQQQPYP